MGRIRIETLHAGSVLDDLMARSVMGWWFAHSGPPDPNLDYWTDETGKVLYWCQMWNPSTNLEQAFECTEKLNAILINKRDGIWYVEGRWSGDHYYYPDISWGASVQSQELPLAICKAILWAKQRVVGEL